MQSYTFKVPQKPQGKGRGRAFNTPKGVRVRTPGKTRNYEALVADVAAQAMDGGPMLRGPLGLKLLAVFPRSQHLARCSKRDGKPMESTDRLPYGGLPDLDNVIKAICDAIEGTMLKNDSRIVIVHAAKMYSLMALQAGHWCEERPHVQVTVSEVMP